MIKLLVFVGLLGAVLCHPHYRTKVEQGKADTCGYPSCPTAQPGKLNVHLVPHTHDDVGWLKTLDQYYYGSRSNIQNAGVQYILDSVVDELIHDPNKKFIYVETSFFWKWWMEQTDDLRHQVKLLVANGQLEFINGGWVMNDEAASHYQSVIDQFTWGFRKLNDTFGYCGQPRVGWQIDPFGHSRETASLMAQLGFDGVFFARLDYQDKDTRLKSKTMEMIWEGSSSLGSDADLLTSALYYFYGAPGGFCFDVECGDDPIIDNAKSPEYNVDQRVDDFIKSVREQALYYNSNNIIMTFGMDFNYQYAHKNYKNMDKLIRYVNQRQESGSDVNVFYSTPSCYVKSLNEANLTWPTKSDDFFPYASDPHSYWTGYFTSRPTLKYFERKGNNFLQICKQLSALANLGAEDLPDLDTLREAMGVMQHHDAITGTEKQHVAEDYARMLTEGFKSCGMLSSTALSKLHILDPNMQPPPLILRSCPLSNISDCSISAQADNIIVTVYNPISRPDTHFIRLPVSGSSYTVRDPKGAEVPNQVIPIPESLVKIPGRTAETNQELVFKANDIPPLGFRSYYISKSNSNKPTTIKRSFKDLEDTTFGDENLKFSLDKKTGHLSHLATKEDSVAVTQDFLYYIGELGDNGASERRSSGAYVFRSKGSDPITIAGEVQNTVYEGDIVREVHQVYSDWVSQVLRQYKGEDYLEMEWLVGPIPIDDNNGKEIISRFTSNLTTDGIFYTDSSGRETLQRKKDFRPTWELNNQEPVAGNYYPITTDISINNGEAGLLVITDRAQGGSSLGEGQIELMVHRRLLHDDAFGVGEALNETAYGAGLVARGTHWVTLGSLSNPEFAKRKQHLKQDKAILDSYVVLTDAGTVDFDTWSKTYKLEFSGLTNALPDAVQILTLEPWKGSSYLLRLEHLFDKNDAEVEPVTVSLENLFTTFDITSVRETTLGANKWLDESTRLEWQKETNDVSMNKESKRSSRALPEVTLNPKEIRTFICEVTPKSKI